MNLRHESSDLEDDAELLVKRQQLVRHPGVFRKHFVQGFGQHGSHLRELIGPFQTRQLRLKSLELRQGVRRRVRRRTWPGCSVGLIQGSYPSPTAIGARDYVAATPIRRLISATNLEGKNGFGNTLMRYLLICSFKLS